MKKKVILIIDDEEKILNILEEGLELKDLYEIEVSQTSSEFMDLVGQIKYDVLLLDHKMPGKTGGSLAKEIREKDGPNQQTPIIFISGFLKEVQKEVGQIKDIYFLQKPIILKSITDLIEKIS
tara:strand:- start:509 stop:877 length:369 start_codon:yes stop_codon:yes gene_type:complete